MERVKVHHVSKSFLISDAGQQSALQHVISLISGRRHTRRLQALSDVSLSIHSGEIVGVIGDNGGGKSTLLRIIAGIMRPDSGTVGVNGKTVVLTQLGAGVRGRLTVHENIRLIGTLFGLTEKEIKNALNTIVEFAELQDFLHTQWYQCSDGMKQRIMFSTVVHIPCDVLLLDEIFAVGDEHFSKKGLAKLHECAARGASVVITGHHLPVLREHCDRVIWIDEGRVRMEGEVDEVIDAYGR